MILVTGATGNAGAEVLAAALGRGLPVRAGTRSGAHPDAPGVRLDLADPATWDAALAGVRGVFLMLPPGLPPARTIVPFVARVRAGGAGPVVFMSVQGAEGSRVLPHATVERALIAGPRDWTILRPGFFAQNLGDAYLRDIRDDDRLFVPAGRGAVAWLDLADLGAVAAGILADPEPHLGRGYALAGDRSETFADAARHLTHALGREVRYEAASAWGYLAHLGRRGVPPFARLVLLRLHLGLRWGEGDRPTPDLERLLGCAPRTLNDYVRDHVTLWRR